MRTQIQFSWLRRIIRTGAVLAPFWFGWTCAEAAPSLKLQLSWGHRTTLEQAFFLKVSGQMIELAELQLSRSEAEDRVENRAVRSTAGGGDVDGLSCTLHFQEHTINPITNVQEIWRYLLEHTDTGAAERLRADAAWRPDSRKITFQLNPEGTRGFSLTVDQLLRQKAFWLPEFDLFVSAGEPAISFQESQQATLKGRRVLDNVDAEPEATYEQFTARWEDMGSPSYRNPKSVPPGHIVGIGWDSALYKFGVDRFGGVRNDYSKADVFNFRIDFADPIRAWRRQKLLDGLPIISSTFEENGVRCDVEQFAAPLLGPPQERRGDIAMVLFQKISARDLEQKGGSLQLELERELPDSVSVVNQDGFLVVGNEATTWLVIQGQGASAEIRSEGKKTVVAVRLAANRDGAREFVIKLPSPVVPNRHRSALLALDYDESRSTTIAYWNDYLERGAFFHVPDEAVNVLFRANLWHALRLPRRHGGSGPDLRIDLPYSNFAYDQRGTPWPVNQSVYVDYMLYDLRGYHAISAEELAAMFRNNQEANGHVAGFANWGVYTPGMLYSVAQHYLLSGDRRSLELLLPAALRALDWCLNEMKQATASTNPAPGLVLAPLNDLSHAARSWAFNQAYFVAGVDLLGRALAEIDHPRGGECREAARQMRAAVEREFGRASVRSPAVQLADGSWTAYVPCDAQASGRLFEAWYPTDVDTGPLHLPRLRALDPRGSLTTAMLHDHEDNLLIHQWGMINEPVYNQQATAYLLRDEPKRAIRSFYSMMACAFSHTVFEPVEHRWGWGQYFGPPSTDGAWFELYRNMLIHEREDDVLLLAQAAPRAWLQPGKRIEVRRAPTYYGPLSFTLDSETKTDRLKASIELSSRKRPGALLVRFRHSGSKPIQSVLVNGKNWTDFDAEREWVRISNPAENRYTIITQH